AKINIIAKIKLKYKKIFDLLNFSILSHQLYTIFNNSLFATYLFIFSMNKSTSRSLIYGLAAEQCGVMKTLSKLHNSLSLERGSGVVTSNAAPRITLSFNALIKSS